MQLLNRSLTCRQQSHLPCLRRPLPTGNAVAGTFRTVITCARSRRTSPGSQGEEHVISEASEPVSEPAAVPLIRSNRRAAATTGRNRRAAALRSVASPVQTLRDKGILAVDEAGQSFVNIACLGEGKPHWYALALLENKEDAYMGLLTKKLTEAGYSIAPANFTPVEPPTAAEANAASQEKAETALFQAEAAAEVARAEYEANLVGPGEAGAAVRLQAAEAALAAAEREVTDAREARAAAAQAAAAAPQLLEQYDVVVWKPRKKMTVYSHNTDKLVDREVAFSRGTGGATLLLHCVLDPTLAEAIASTYYFLDWRNFQPVSAMLLNQHDLLPEEAELDEVYKLPEPCSESFLLQVANWQHTRESEDLEAERREYYGSGGGSPFGERPEKGAARSDDSNPSRWSVSSGPTNAGAAALIAAGEPLPWEEEQQLQQQAFGGGRGRGRGRAGRGAAGGGRQQWQQQGQQYGQPQYAQAQQQQGFRDQSWDGGAGRGQSWKQNNSYDSYSDSRGRGRGGGRGQQQQQWQPKQQQQRGYAGAAAAFGDEGDRPPAEDSYSKQNRQRQMDWMEDMGGSRYQDDDFDDAGGSYGSSSGGSSSGGSSSRWQQPTGRQQQQQQWQPPQQPRGGQAGAGRDGGTTRMRQLDFTGDMGSDRYSDDEDQLDYDRLEGLDGSRQGFGEQRQQRPMGGGRDKGATMSKQLGFMAEMGSDRYSDEDDDMPDAATQRGGSRSSSGNFSDLLADVAEAFDYMDDLAAPSFAGAASSSPTARNNAAGQGLDAAGRQGSGPNPGKASYMDEDSMEWGRDDAAQQGGQGLGGDDGAAAAQAVLQAWQSEGQPGSRPYKAELSTRSQEGLGASFEFEIDAGPGLASADSLMGQLPDFTQEMLEQPPQQRQQPELSMPPPPPPAAAAAKRKGRASTSSRRSKKTEDAAAAAEDGPTAVARSSSRKTSSRKPASRSKQQQGAAAGGDVAPEGWVGGADASDVGFEEGWVNRMMDDGNDRAGIDDVMRS